jgi:hypothetical protein
MCLSSFRFTRTFTCTCKPLSLMCLSSPLFSFAVQATEWIKGQDIEEVIKIKNSQIAKHLSLPPVKLHCSMLAEDAIKVGVGV